MIVIKKRISEDYVLTILHNDHPWCCIYIPNIRTVFKYLFKNWTFSVDFLTEWVVHSCSNCLLILNLSSHSAPLLNGAGQVEQNEKRTWPALNLYYCNHLQKEIWNSIFSLLVIWNILACPNHSVVFCFNQIISIKQLIAVI